MSELRELYQELILDHGRNPRNFGAVDDADHIHEGFNPVCGDRLKLYLSEKNQIVSEVKFIGSGCAISMASASLMTEALKGKKLSDVENLFTAFHQLVTGENKSSDQNLGKLTAFSGVAEYPARVKCATLAWHTLQAALKGKKEVVSTE